MMPPTDTSSATRAGGGASGRAAVRRPGRGRGHLLAFVDGWRRGRCRFTLDHELGDRPCAIGAKIVGEAIDRMSAPEEPERFLLEVELLDLGPCRDVGQRHHHRRGPVIAAAEHVELAQILVALLTRAVLTGAVDRGEQPGAPFRQKRGVGRPRRRGRSPAPAERGSTSRRRRT